MSRARRRQQPGARGAWACGRGLTSLATEAAGVCALLASVALCACANKEAQQQLGRLVAPVAHERADAAQRLGALARSSDDEVWVALEKATRDPAPAVRIAAAGALLKAPRAVSATDDERGSVADDAVAVLLGDVDEGVRIAAAGVLGKRCGPRAVAYLQGGFNRSGLLARAAIADALLACGVKPEELFAHAEDARRQKALGWLEDGNSAHRAWAARELGWLGRDGDVQRLMPLLDDEDGAVVAAAAAGLGHAGALRATPKLVALAGDPVPLVSAAALQALLELGPEALRSGLQALTTQAVAAGEQAVPAALGLSQIAAADRLCALALDAHELAAAALLARDCPAAPFAEALARAVPAKGPPSAGDAARLPVLLEALLQARPAAPSPAAATALGRLAQLEAGPISERAAEAAGALGAVQAGPLLLDLVRRGRAVREKELAERSRTEADDHEAAAEIARQAARAPDPDREKYAKLMKLLQDRKGKVDTRAGAAEQLATLLRGERPSTGARRLLAASLRAVLALGTPGADAEAAALAGDPDRELAAAARSKAPAGSGTPPGSAAQVPPTADPGLAACFAPAPAGTLHAAPPGCLARALSLDPSALPAGALPAARAALWSDDGAERAAACSLLGRASDPPSTALRGALAQDPEQRVRGACLAKKETAPPAPR